MHSNRARINKTEEICMKFFVRTIVIASYSPFTWELCILSSRVI